ncbi:MAG: secondary thiamine-phosphate synthase enzyme YjbQ [Chloroflexi bacterium]|nr:secondary thiamine-phosphate synthase enzyme YjbQ [Chloroflexota bacterium]
MKVHETTFRTCLFTLDVRCTTAPEFIDITDRVVEAVEQSDIRNGFVVVFSRHTTAAIIIQENEPLLLVDMANTLERIAPKNVYYRHNDFGVRTVHMHEDECPNGHSHCRHMFLGTSETIPVVDGQLPLGEFQRIFMVELDEEKKRRKVLVQVMGM